MSSMERDSLQVFSLMLVAHHYRDHGFSKVPQTQARGSEMATYDSERTDKGNKPPRNRKKQL